jgi:hypothetical protein
MQHLAYPKGLSASEQTAARAKLATLPGDLAQQLLDELAGRIVAGTLLVSSLAYQRSLVSRASTDNFTPESALPIAERRKRQRQIEATLRQTEVATVTCMHSYQPDSLLLRQLDAIRRRSRCGSDNAE